MDMNHKGMLRLNDVVLQSIKETQMKIENLKVMLDSYIKLKARLTTLPDRLSHKIMVPFGKIGFMPGKLINTNQVTILLGDNWFVKTSTKHASEIVDRRKLNIQMQINNFEKQKLLLESRYEYSSEFIQENEECVEIIEDYDPDEELKWKEKHKDNVRNSKRTNMREMTNFNNQNEGADDETQSLIFPDLFTQNNNIIADYVHPTNQLSNSKDFLEISNDQKKQNNKNELEMHPDSRAIEKDEPEARKKLAVTISKDSCKKNVKWKIDSNDLTDENYNENSVVISNKSIVINFNHTHNVPTPITNDDCIKTPGDIFRIYHSKPKSILKKKRNKDDAIVENNIQDKNFEVNNNSAILKFPSMACSELVKERFTETSIVSTDPISLSTAVNTTHNNKNSKFKMSRLKKL